MSGDRSRMEFEKVDSEPNPTALVKYLDSASAVASIRRYKEASFQLLNLREGDHVLEVGCGAGDDALAMAAMVGRGGRVVGVDLSETMINEANQRAAGKGLPVEFRHGDACRLEFAAGTFDCCRADRVLQHVEQPFRALQEMARILRRGGRLVVSEPDWETMMVDMPDRSLTRKIINYRTDSHAGPWIGRQLFGFFRQLGFGEVSATPAGVVITDYQKANEIWSLERFAAAAEAAGVVSGMEAERWLAYLRTAGEAGTLFTAAVGFNVAGIKA